MVCRALLVSVLLYISPGAIAAELKPISLVSGYQHDRFVTLPKDAVFVFRGYMSSFDTDGNGGLAPWGIPDFVAYEMREFSGTLGKSPGRPSPWITNADLAIRGLAPKDATYRYSRAFRTANPNWYVRGHLAMKHHAWRLGANADWNTHTMMNAVPQRALFNRSIWLDLEDRTAEWADEFEAVWIIAGPIMRDGQPTERLGEPTKGEMQIAIPDMLFKIVIKESGDLNRPNILAFIYPQDDEGYGSSPYDHSRYLVSVDEIERSTGLDFLTVLPDDDEEEIERIVADELWN